MVEDGLGQGGSAGGIVHGGTIRVGSWVLSSAVERVLIRWGYGGVGGRGGGGGGSIGDGMS